MKGILFKPWKQKAIRESPLDRLWQTRSLDHLKEINKEPDAWCISGYKDGVWGFGNLHCEGDVIVKPRYQVGEVVYIEETFCIWCYGKSIPCYKEDYNENCDSATWVSPLFCPSSLARYFIKITDVRVGRLQSITPEDCLWEGLSLDFKGASASKLIEHYAVLWDSINPKYPWSSNPWDFVYTFKKVEKP